MSVGDLRLHFVRCGINFDVDFHEETENLAERNEVVALEGKRYVFVGDEIVIKAIKDLLPELGKKEMSKLDLKTKLQQRGAEEVSLTTVSSVDLLAKQVVSELGSVAKDSWKWLTTQYDELALMLHPKPSIPFSLPEVDLFEVLNNPQYAQYHYAIHNNSLYLTDGKVGVFKVNLLENLGDKDQYGAQKFISLIDPQNVAHHSTLPFRQVIENLIQKTVDSQKEKFSVNFFYKGYSQFYGIPETFFKNTFTVSHLLNFSKNVLDIAALCENSFTNGQDRALIAHVLQVQEEEILAQLPPAVLLDPIQARYFLTVLLAEKGLTYETAVAQFDRELGGLEKNAAEGSYVIAKLIAQIDAWEALQSKAKSKGEAVSFPFQEIWRFFIDGEKEKYGAYFFENEPFYMLSSLRGLKNILDSQKPLNMETYEEYATALTRDPPVMRRWGGLTDPEFPNLFFNTKPKMNNQGFDPSSLKQDPLGISDLKERTLACREAEEIVARKDKEVSEGVYWIANATGFSYNTIMLWASMNTSHTIIFQRIFLGLEQLLQKASSPGERLIAYIWAARELEITHQMEDANGRTSITSLIKWIAEDPELPIYLPEDPNILDCQGPEALIRDVHSGMRRFQSLSGNNPDNIVSVDILLDQSGVKGQPWDFVHQRAQLPEKTIAKLVAEDIQALRISRPKGDS